VFSASNKKEKELMSVERTKTKEKDTETPLMKQYNGFKAKYPDAILLLGKMLYAQQRYLA
jgi:hypothetical protein